MFVFEHLLVAALAAFCVGVCFPSVGFGVAFFWLGLAQCVDLDHYRGSFRLLLRGGLATRLEDVPGSLRRGFLHSPFVFLPLAFVLWWGWGVEGKLLAAGVSLHMLCDSISSFYAEDKRRC